MKSITQLREGKFLVKINHQHDDGAKIHEYEVTAPNQNKADHQAIAMHLKKHPGTMGKFHMWDNQQIESAEAQGESVNENTKKKRDSMLVVHGAMTRDEFNRKWGKKTPTNKLAGPGGTYKNLVRTEEVQNEEGLKDACWKGYEAIGMKMKNGRKVPNCVPKEEAQNEAMAKVSVTRPIGHRIADIGPGGKEHNVQTKDWPGDHATAAQTAHQAAHAALKKGDIDTYHKEMDKKFASHQAAAAEAGKKPVKTFESADDEKNLKITKHEKMAVEAEKRGDKHAQQYHLQIVSRLKNESVNEATEPKMQRHLVTVTVVDPHHPMTSKRKEKIMKRAKVTAKDPKDAVSKAEAHYKKHGFKVHDSLHHSIVNESLDTDEFVDQYDPENENPAACYPNETAEKGVTENNDTPEAETEEEKAEQIQRLKMLIRFGFLELPQLPIALRVIKRLEKGQTVALEQEKEVLELMMEKLLGLVTGDEFMFRRSRQLVQK